MNKDRTAYWREYARKNAAKRKATKAAYRARNKAEIAAYARAYRIEKHEQIKAKRAGVSRAKKQIIAEKPVEKSARMQAIRERFAAFRARKQEGDE